MTPLEFEYVVDRATISVSYALSNQRLMQKLNRQPLMRVFVLLNWAVLYAPLIVVILLGGHGVSSSLIFALLACVFLSVYFYQFYRRHLFHALAALVTNNAQKCFLSVDENGILYRVGQTETYYPWIEITAVVEQPGWFGIVVGQIEDVLPVPDSAFADEQQQKTLIAALEAGINSTGRAAVTETTSSEAAFSVFKNASNTQREKQSFPIVKERHNFFYDLKQLGAILLFRFPAPGAFSPDAGKFIILMFLFCVLTLAVQMIETGFPGKFVSYGLKQIFSPFAWGAFIAALMAVMSGRRNQFGTLYLAISLLLLPLPLLNTWWNEASWNVAKVIRETGIGDENTSFLFFRWFLFFLPFLWLSIAASIVTSRLTWSINGVRNISVSFLTVLLMIMLFSTHSYSPVLWESVRSQQEAHASMRLDEGLLYGESLLLEQKLAQIQAGVPGVPELYFLGVGGDAQQDVFMRELRSVEALFAERYGTVGHSLILLNNRETVHELPLANTESLRLALKRIGTQMNEEDVLFLFLTSHGSKKHHFSFDFWPFDFNDLTPGKLRQILDESGVHHRIVVVSACYSGGFIPALQDENTLVITAASADRSSFGCSNGNDFTDFGRAYFDEALRQTRSFTEAFEIARKNLAEREKDKGAKASLPQMQGGEKLVEVLDVFLKSVPSTTSEPSAAAPLNDL